MSESKKGFDLAAVLGSVSKSDTASRQIVDIDIDRIKPDPRNFYRVDKEGVEELAGNIELVGLQQPVLLREEGDGYVVISGHRRMAALQRLVKEGKEQFRRVPSIIEAPDELPELTELKLIFANSGTRRLTDPELAEQTKRCTELFYALQQKGVEFPGRMRDHVAEAVKVSRTKINTLNVIETKLREDLKLRWQKGEISTDGAYNLARMPEVLQKMAAEQKGKLAVDYLRAKVHRKGCDGCTNGMRFAEHDFHVRNSWEMCCGTECCMSCYKVCSFRCPAAAEQKKKEKAEQRQRKKAEEAKNEADRRENTARTRAVWSRIAPGAKTRGLTVQEVLQKTRNGSPWKCNGIERILADPEAKADNYLHGDLVDVVEDVATVARLTGCSADYICGLTDDPAPAAVRPEPKMGDGGWFDGSVKPPVKELSAVLILETGRFATTAKLADWRNGKWRFAGSNDTIEAPVRWWIPKPEEAKDA